MAITFRNEINDSNVKITCAVHFGSGRCKHTSELTFGQSDSIKWGLLGHGDDKAHDVLVKVNISSGLDAHPYLSGVYDGNTIVVKEDKSKPDGTEKTFVCNLTATHHYESHRGYYIQKA
ncbi:MAG: hypothetical protein JKX79_11085 [Labilibaculum sp.]|nr:hypothetical protein [Labilibaculum sp.]